MLSRLSSGWAKKDDNIGQEEGGREEGEEVVGISLSSSSMTGIIENGKGKAGMMMKRKAGEGGGGRSIMSIMMTAMLAAFVVGINAIFLARPDDLRRPTYKVQSMSSSLPRHHHHRHPSYLDHHHVDEEKSSTTQERKRRALMEKGEQELDLLYEKLTKTIAQVEMMTKQMNSIRPNVAGDDNALQEAVRSIEEDLISTKINDIAILNKQIEAKQQQQQQQQEEEEERKEKQLQQQMAKEEGSGHKIKKNGHHKKRHDETMMMNYEEQIARDVAGGEVPENESPLVIHDTMQEEEGDEEEGSNNSSLLINVPLEEEEEEEQQQEEEDEEEALVMPPAEEAEKEEDHHQHDQDPIAQRLRDQLAMRDSDGTTTTILPLRLGSCQTTDCRMLITGCGRAGTHYVGDLFKDNQLDVLHERIGSQGSVSWIYAADFNPANAEQEKWFSSAQDVELRQDPKFTFFPIIHLVRHPLTTIASLVNCFCGCGSLTCGRWADTPSWQFAGKHVQFSNRLCRSKNRDNTCLLHQGNGRLIRAMEYWLAWNKMSEEKAHYRMQMENINIRELFATVGLDQPDQEIVLKPFASKSRFRRTKVTWAEMEAADAALAKEVYAMAQRYGYDKVAPPTKIV